MLLDIAFREGSIAGIDRNRGILEGLAVSKNVVRKEGIRLSAGGRMEML